ncbi:MAG TPA: hypothetical protein VGQ83_06875 [Polyangia bacterium]|jgi:hypothetical protein
MTRLMGFLCVLALVASPVQSEAKPKKAKAAATKAKKAPPPPKVSEQTTRAIGELAGKYKWGMTSQQVIDVITKDITASYADKMKKASSNPLEQDRLRDDMNAEINKVRESLIKFTGQKTSWDISIVDQEYAHKNNESMLIYWEANQRRFFFFENDKLWKQLIALNAELFEGKSFDEFAAMIAQRYGEPQRIMATDSKGKETLDHLEWPASGDHFLKAIDQVSMYGSYCLVLAQKSVLDGIEARRKENNPRHKKGSGADQIFKGKVDPDKGDGNSDVVDQITGRQKAKPEVKVDDDTAIVKPAGTVVSDSAGDEPKKKPAKKKAAKKKK